MRAIGLLPATLWLAIVLIAVRAEATRIVVEVPPSTPTDAQVYLAGSLESVGQWRADGVRLTRREDGRFVVDIDVPTGRRLEYKITRGNWQSVEKDASGAEIANRILSANADVEVFITVAKWADTNPPATQPSSVTGDLRIVELGEEELKRSIRIWLPRGYASDADVRYRVVYLHDGQNCFDRQTSAFGDEWQVDESLSTLIASETIQPIIAVGIDNLGSRRMDEYTTSQDSGRGGKGEAYQRFVVEVVKPYVDQHFRTKPARDDTFIAGSSLGGLASLDMLRRYPDTFGGAIALSPSLWWNDEAMRLAYEREPLKNENARIYLAMGEQEGRDEQASREYVDQIHRFRDVLSTQKVHVGFLLFKDGVHNEASWARQFPDAIRFLLSEQ